MAASQESSALDPQKPRKVRIVCISDTHNKSPSDGCFKLPPGDVLIHAGDLTNQGTQHELKAALDWIDAADYEAKIVIAGNHDITLDRPYYEKKGTSFFHDRYPQSPDECAALVRSYASITYLQHEAARITLRDSPDKPGVSFTVFGSPYSPGYGGWAFTYAHKYRDDPRYEMGTASGAGEDFEAVAPQSGQQLWEAIPDGTDITITHTPPFGHRDWDRKDRSCPELLEALWRVKPQLAICGHVHEGWGAEVVTWEDHPAQEGLVNETQALDLPRAGKKFAKVDLTRAKASVDQADMGPQIASGSPPDMRQVGRRTTCIVNAAIKVGGLPGPQFNKAITVDIILPALAR